MQVHGKSVPLIRQMGTTDCGIACLTMLFQYYGFNIDISEMKARIKIGRNGVSLAKMRDIAEEYGFSFKAYSDYLEEQNLLSNLPVIMCSKENHFVVVSERKHGKYVVLDPVKGKLKMNYADIQNAFLNILVLIRPSGNISYNKIKSDFQVPVNKTKFVIAILLTFIAQSIVLVPSLVIQNIVNVISYNEHDFAIIKYIIVAFLIRDAKHNMKNNLISILAYAENGECDKIIAFVNEVMDEGGIKLSAVVNSGNIVIDSLIGYWYVRAQKNEINFSVKISIPMSMPFKGADICLILGNLLENAVEAARKVDEKRYIKLQMKYDRNNLLLCIANNYKGRLIKTKDKKLKSTKLDAGNHGVGLASVHRAAAKYHGNVFIDDSVPEQFLIRVVLYGE